MDEAKCRAMVELVRRIRHDANSPLTAVLGNVQLLMEEPAAQDPEVQESLRLIEGEVKRLVDIVGELKEVRLEGGGEVA